MAVLYTYTGSEDDIIFDFTNQEINCGPDFDSLTIQELVDACREAEYAYTGGAFPKICNAAGKEYLDINNGVQVGITIVLLDNWVVYSEKVSGVFRVLGGNLVQVSGGDPFKENAALTYINILSAASTVVSVSSGSGLSTAEHNKLMGLPDTTFDDTDRTTLEGIATDQADQLTEDRFKELNFNKVNTVSGGLINNYRPNNEFNVAVTRDGDNVPTAETIVP